MARVFHITSDDYGKAYAFSFVGSTEVVGARGPSSLGSWMTTWSGSGILGPVLPVGSQGSMIVTRTPSIPWRSDTWRTAVSMYCRFGSPDLIM